MSLLLIIVSLNDIAASELSVKNGLISYGVDNPIVSISDDSIQVHYDQKLSEVLTLDEEATRLSNITKIVSEEMPEKSAVIIQQIFDDGQIMEFHVKVKDARDYLTKRIDTDKFIIITEMRPLTRGLFIVPETCKPYVGDNCQNAQACSCYQNETCRIGDQYSDVRGCVVVHIPTNAHSVGSEYICNQKYVWNKESTDCIPLEGMAEDINTTYPPANNIRRELCGRDREFVIALFQSILERDPYKEEIEDKIYDLDTGMSRQEMVIRFFKSREYREQKKSGVESYRDAFQAVLGRDPSVQELRTFPRTQPYMMARGLLETDEYRTLCSKLK